MPEQTLFQKIIWFSNQQSFNIDYFDLLLPRQTICSDPRFLNGHFYSAKCGRNIQYESGLELEFIRLLESASSVRFYVEQPVRIPYRRGKKKLTYTPDFGIYFHSGAFILAEIKPLHAMLEDRVQTKMEGLIEFCRQRGFGLLLTDGRHTLDRLKKIPLNRSLEKEILCALKQEPIRRKQYAELVEKCGASHQDILKIILKHDLYFTAFPFKLKSGKYNALFRQVFVEGIIP
ncbi:MAG: Tn7 transposase TnsA N-terminal domain-containing protein [Rikenellaceae bacterium]|nr:Tn7 transposase TnsA N-terminal domain-containing protein [Rikenellaceae bacterium]